MKNPMYLTKSEIAKMIDHSLLRPEMTDDEIVEECHTAKQLNVKAVCVRPLDVKICKDLLKNTKVSICTVIGFPHGNSTIQTKLFETELAMADGAVELDLVIPIGRARSGHWDYVKEEIKVITEAVHKKNAIIKVIFENAYLTDKEIIKCCEICSELKVDFVKTSTGYAPSGAKLDDIRLMRRHCPSEIEIKAAGGIRTLDDFLAFYEAGSTRMGTRSTKAILEEAEKREKTENLS